MRRVLFFYLLVCLPLAGQEIPRATGLPDFPFSIKNTWIIGGTGSWDYLALDAEAKRLYIAHSSTVQVVDIGSGALIGEIQGFREAHAIALDDTGSYGYVSDGPAGDVKVFNRRKLVVEASIPIYCSPRSVAFEPQNKLVFALCGATTVAQAAPQGPNQRPTATGGARSNGAGQQAAAPGGAPGMVTGAVSGISHVVAIDAGSRSVLADIALAGDYRFADADGQGQVYVSVGAVDSTYAVNGHAERSHFPQRIARIDAQAIVTQAQSHQAAQSSASSSAGNEPLKTPLHIDWGPTANTGSLVGLLPLDASCANPQGLAVDGKHQRVFVACEDQRFAVLDGTSGNVIASLTTGPGDDTIGYDPDHGLIFIANGGGYGSLTIVRQDATTDSYEVIQNLPTKERARTLAVDSTTGVAYMVTDYHGVDLTQQGGIGSLKSIPLSGSFQVVVVGH